MIKSVRQCNWCFLRGAWSNLKAPTFVKESLTVGWKKYTASDDTLLRLGSGLCLLKTLDHDNGLKDFTTAKAICLYCV